jgi:hypothetical protein
VTKTVQTDADGRYRLNVEPGRYWIAAGLADRTGLVENPTYFPGVTAKSDPTIPGRQAVTVTAGQAGARADFALRPVSFASAPANGGPPGIVTMDDGSPLPAIRLGRRVAGPDGGVKEVYESYLALLVEVNGQPVGPNEPEPLRGSHIGVISTWIRPPYQRAEKVVTVPQLPSGYYVKSMTYGDIDLTKSPLTVRNDQSVIEIVLTRTRPASLPPGVRLSGRLTDLPFGSKLDTRLVLTPAANERRARVGQTPATIVLANSNDGSFEIRGVVPGRYTLAAVGYSELQNPAGARLLQLKPMGPGLTIEVGAADVTNLELTFEP